MLTLLKKENMGRIIAIDYGRKRCGIAVTDILRICANGLPTVRTCDIFDFIQIYISSEPVDEIVIGEPKDLKGNPSDSMKYINPFIQRLHKEFPDLSIKMFDERFTSTIAHQEMIAGGFKKKTRENKGKTDEMAAVLILTSYLESLRERSLQKKSNDI